jgi:NitT/TauT family transport system substrate-binding protein
MFNKWVLCFMILVLSLTACQPVSTQDSGSEALIPLVLCYSSLAGSQAATWYAFENGYYEKYGLDVEMMYISSGSKAVSALIAGDVAICSAAGSAVVNAVAAGQDAVMIAGMYNVYTGSLFVTPEIQTAADLVGKTVGVTQVGSSNDAGMRIALKSLGLVPDQDVTILPIGDEAERLQAVIAGQTVGTVLTSPMTLIAADLGYREMVDLTHLGVPYQATGLVSTRAYLDAHPAEVEAFLKATIDAIHHMKQDPEGSKTAIAKYMQLDLVKDARSLEDAYQNLVLSALEAFPYPTLEGIQTLIDLSAVANPAVLQVKPEQVVDTSILEKIDASDFVETLQ